MNEQAIANLTAFCDAFRSFGESLRRGMGQARQAAEQRRRDIADELDWLGEWRGRRG